MNKIKVIIVDDSILMQALLAKILNSDPNIIVVGMAENPLIAREMIKLLKPDVLLLDVEMPEMDGLTFLEKLMRLHPMPVVMCSAFTPHCLDVTLEAFRLGVVDVIGKPILDNQHQEVIEKVKAAAIAKVKQSRAIDMAKIHRLKVSGDQNFLPGYVVAIGASTGGTEALKTVFNALPSNFPPIVVTQHLPEGFSALFAERANRNSELKIVEAKEGDVLKPGHAYIAPGGKHLEIETKDNRQFIRLVKSERISGHIPSVDAMMTSVAKVMGKHSAGILLTGMGSDGAQGLLALRQAGGITIAQDEETSVVWGMPKVAIDLGAVNYVLPIHKIPDQIIQCMNLISS